jgi:hypothetical protein
MTSVQKVVECDPACVVTRKQGDVKRLSWCTCEITKEIKEREWDRFRCCTKIAREREGGEKSRGQERGREREKAREGQ